MNPNNSISFTRAVIIQTSGPDVVTFYSNIESNLNLTSGVATFKVEVTTNQGETWVRKHFPSLPITIINGC